MLLVLRIADISAALRSWHYRIFLSTQEKLKVRIAIHVIERHPTDLFHIIVEEEWLRTSMKKCLDIRLTKKFMIDKLRLTSPLMTSPEKM